MTEAQPSLDQQNETIVTGGDSWQRLHPMAIVHYGVKALQVVLDQGINLLPAFAVLITFFQDQTPQAILGAGVVVLFIGFAFGVLSYLRFRYRIQGNSFLVRKGVVSTKRLTLDFDRVQSINISEPIYFRPLGLAVVALESAGSSSAEVSLNGVPLALAKSYRARILAHQKTQEAESDDTPAAIEEDRDRTVLVTKSLPDLVRYGLSNNQIWIFAGLFASVIGGNSENIAKLILPEIGGLIEALTSLGVLGKVAMGLFVVGGIALLLLGFSVANAILKYKDYKLVRERGRLIRTSGLGELKESSLKESKIQAVELAQNFIAKLLGRRHMMLKQAGQQVTPGNAAEGGFLVPSLWHAEESKLVATLLPGLKPDLLDYSTISSRYILRSFAFFFLFPVIAGTSYLSLFLGPKVLLISFLSFIALPFIVLRHRRFGYAFSDQFGAIKSGLIGQGTRYFELRKVQKVRLTQSPSERRHDLATIKIFLAGSSISIPYMPLDDARLMLNLCLKAAQSDPRPWM